MTETRQIVVEGVKKLENVTAKIVRIKENLMREEAKSIEVLVKRLFADENQ